MTIEYLCPVCRETNQLPDEQEGQLSVCRRCRLKFIAPPPRPGTTILSEDSIAEILPPTPPVPSNPFAIPTSSVPPFPDANPFAVSYSDDSHPAMTAPTEGQVGPSGAYINPGKNPFLNPVPGSALEGGPIPPPPPANGVDNPFSIPDSGQVRPQGGGLDPFSSAEASDNPFAIPQEATPGAMPPLLLDPFPPPPPDPFPPPKIIAHAPFPPQTPPLQQSPSEFAPQPPDNPFAAPVPETAPQPTGSGAISSSPASSGFARSPAASGAGPSPAASGAGPSPAASGTRPNPAASGTVREPSVTSTPDPQDSSFDPAQRPARYYLAVVDGAEMQSFKFFQGSSYIIGRDGAADIKILSKSVSRQHARIETDGPQPILFDLGSANGTVVNGAKVSQLALRDGDLIKFGEVILRFQTD